MHPDRLLPADPATRAVARNLYERVRAARILSPHGHVDARVLADDAPFPDPASLLIQPDHYVIRLLHANGVPLEQLGLPSSRPLLEPESRSVWRAFCAHWDKFLGTPVRYWLESQFEEVFGIDRPLSTATADAVYDEISARLTEPAFRPRRLFGRFGIEILATTDDPVDSLEAHERLRTEAVLPGTVIPTFRPDRYLDPASPSWASDLERLAEAADTETDSYAGTLRALRRRRRHFLEHGATSLDIGVRTPDSAPLEDGEAEALHRRARRGQADEADIARYRANMVYRQAEMSAEDGLTMQLHAGVHRNHHRPTFDAFGPDTGHDIPVRTDFVEPLRPLLNAFGTSPSFRLVLFTVDETVFSRELAPLAGFYPSVYVGAPWWFLDTPAAGDRFRRAVTDSAGLFKTSGFIDDTRAFCSIPARHDMARRVDAAFLASLVTTHQLEEETAGELIEALVDEIPRRVFNLPSPADRKE